MSQKQVKGNQLTPHIYGAKTGKQTNKQKTGNAKRKPFLKLTKCGKRGDYRSD